METIIDKLFDLLRKRLNKNLTLRKKCYLIQNSNYNLLLF